MTVQAIDTRQFRSALGTFATGVSIVTTRDAAGHDIGLTVNSFNSVSLDPPMVLWSLAKTSHSLDAFLGAEHFAVHILAADQEPLSNLFSRSGADKFAGLTPSRGHGDVPLLEGCAARFECRTAFRYAGGDHEIFVGAVITFEHFDRPPLVFQGGRYAVAVRKAGPPDGGDGGTGVEASFSRDFLGYLLARAHRRLTLPLRREFDRKSLSEEQYFVLSILGAEDNRSVAEMDAAARAAGLSITCELVEDLAARGFASIEGGEGAATRVRLTELGLRSDIELVAAAKAAEADAQMNLDYAEMQTLKHLLKRLLADSDLPAPPGSHDPDEAQ